MKDGESTSLDCSPFIRNLLRFSATSVTKLVENYFALIKQLRAGEASSINRLIQLWDDDGTFEFAGSPPVTGVFRGRNAILALYQNRFHANKMPLHLEGEGKKNAPERQAALGVVDTEVQRTKVMDHKLVAGWTTTVGTQDGRGFQVAGVTLSNSRMAKSVV